jgi:hypothetical protein
MELDIDKSGELNEKEFEQLAKVLLVQISGRLGLEVIFAFILGARFCAILPQPVTIPATNPLYLHYLQHRC